jgi:hypothetical protein
MNEYPDLKEWCGHAFVSLRTWACPECKRPLNEQAQHRLLSASTVAPTGQLWVFQERTQPDFADHEESSRIGYPCLFTDRTIIARKMVRDAVIDAESLRERLEQIHWYQGVYNIHLFEGWDEDGSIRFPAQYKLCLAEIDRAA